MGEASEFRRGDVVIHPLRPEWGDGVVQQAARVSHQGQPAQRLVIQFANYGRATIHTGVVPLVPREKYRTMSTSQMSRMSSSSTTSTPTTGGQGWLDSLRGEQPNGHELHQLPEELTDPFRSLSARLKSTLDSFRFSTEPRALIDWAVAQTGLNDPLSKYTRHELEQAFPRFARQREQHLVQLVREAKRASRLDVLQEAAANAPSDAARTALQRAVKA